MKARPPYLTVRGDCSLRPNNLLIAAFSHPLRLSGSRSLGAEELGLRSPV